MTAMDIGTIRGLGTLLVMLAFIGLLLWVFAPRRKRDFDEATLLPFADDPQALDKLERKPDETPGREEP